MVNYLIKKFHIGEIQGTSSCQDKCLSVVSLKHFCYCNDTEAI